MTPNQRKALLKSFQAKPFPNLEERHQLAMSLNISEYRILLWFGRKRAACRSQNDQLSCNGENTSLKYVICCKIHSVFICCTRTHTYTHWHTQSHTRIHTHLLFFCMHLSGTGYKLQIHTHSHIKRTHSLICRPVIRGYYCGLRVHVHICNHSWNYSYS